MSVAQETLRATLKEMIEFEEFAVQNLAQVQRFDFSSFTPQERKEIFYLLDQLREDSHEHEGLIEIVIQRLRHGPKENQSQPRGNSLGFSGSLRP